MLDREQLVDREDESARSIKLAFRQTEIYWFIDIQNSCNFMIYRTCENFASSRKIQVLFEGYLFVKKSF